MTKNTVIRTGAQLASAVLDPHTHNIGNLGVALIAAVKTKEAK